MIEGQEATLQSLIDRGGPVVVITLVVSVIVLAIALERVTQLLRFRRAVRRADDRVMEAARRGELEEARRLCEPLPSPVREVFAAGLDRALSRVRGQPAAAMQRELKRAGGELRSWVWILGTAGALMPFVGLLGTVIGVMGSFAAIGRSGTGGFPVVSAGISEALLATAAGLGVALLAVVFFNVLQNAIARAGRDLGLLVDELAEILQTLERDRAGAA